MGDSVESLAEVEADNIHGSQSPFSALRERIDKTPKYTWDASFVFLDMQSMC